jgi:hypothetical protein
VAFFVGLARMTWLRSFEHRLLQNATKCSQISENAPLYRFGRRLPLRLIHGVYTCAVIRTLACPRCACDSCPVSLLGRATDKPEWRKNNHAPFRGNFEIGLEGFACGPAAQPEDKNWSIILADQTFSFRFAC